MTIMIKFYDYTSYTLRIEQLNDVKSISLNDLLTNLYVRDLFKNDLIKTRNSISTLINSCYSKKKKNEIFEEL